MFVDHVSHAINGVITERTRISVADLTIVLASVACNGEIGITSHIDINYLCEKEFSVFLDSIDHEL